MRGGRPVPPAGWHRRQPWRRLKLVSLDFEATGLDLSRDRVISFGAVPITSARIDVGDSVYQLVDPGPVPPSAESVTVHGLRPVDLVGAPDVDAAREALGRAIEGRFLVTWAASVEAGFLSVLYGGSGRSWLRRCIDARELAFALASSDDLSSPFTLTTVAERYNVPVANPHHALDDALVTAQLFLILATRLAERGVVRVRDLQSIRRQDPPVLRRPRAPV